MGIFRSLSGVVVAELTSADREGALQRINEAGVTLYQVEEVGPLCLRFLISRQDLAVLRSVTDRRGDILRYHWDKGIYRSGRRLMKRPVLLLGIVSVMLLTIILPTRIYFIEVVGADQVPEKRIISQAVLCGVRFGASRRDIRSEQVKNKLLEAIPELQWVGVNTYGCRAVISVRERSVQENDPAKQGIASIVAARDCIVGEMTVTRGTAICSPGDAVSKGQVIISGVTDLGSFIRGEVAEGEVFGETQRELTLFAPQKLQRKTTVISTSRKFCVIFGKKRIFFFKGSGISDATCDKMYTEYRMTLPGGFRLPIAFGIEETVTRDMDGPTTDQDLSEDKVLRYVDPYLSSLMISGKILDREETVMEEDGFLVSKGSYHCYEMIGITRIEENLYDYEADRTERERRAS